MPDRVIRLVEASRVESVELTPEQAWAVTQSRIAEVLPTRRAGYFDLIAGNLVGTVRCDTCVVTIKPKLPVAQLMTMIGFNLTGLSTRVGVVHLEEDDLSVAAVLAFLDEAESALRGGLLKSYVMRNERASTLRGRLRLADQIARHHDRLTPLEIEHDELTADIAENQILLAAASFAHRSLTTINSSGAQSASRKQAIERARSLCHRLRARVTCPVRLPGWKPTRANRHYQGTLLLAELILAHSGTGSTHGGNASLGLLIDVAAVFENFVGRGARCVRGDLAIRTQRNFSLLTNSSTARRMTVDLHASDPKTGKSAVLDTKYKKRELSPADVYQLHTYAHVLGLDAAHLIYASPQGEHMHEAHRISGTGIVIHRHSLDLSAPLSDVLHQLEAVFDIALPRAGEHRSEREI